MTVPASTKAYATRAELKRAARRLFALRGIAAVGLREVAQEAGQRNTAAVHYHFGTKDDLLRELLVEGAVAIDIERQALLDAAEANGAVTMRDVVDALVAPSLHLETDPGSPETWYRFMANLIGERRGLFEETIVGHHAAGYDRCTALIRRLLPDLPVAEVNRRIVMAIVALQAFFAAREAALDTTDDRPHPFWGRDDVTTGIGATIEAILLQR